MFGWKEIEGKKGEGFIGIKDPLFVNKMGEKRFRGDGFGGITLILFVKL